MGAMSPLPPAPVREPAWSVSHAAIGLWLFSGVLGTVLYGAAAAAFVVLVPDDAGGPVPVLRWVLPALVVLYGVLFIGVVPRLRYRVHRWEVTAEAVYTLTGWLARTWTLVPVSRIQTVDVTRGVVQQLFGLASVAVLTASSQGTVRIPHLDADVARRVADDLARRAETVRDEAT
jgi:membrane protein YdbS with pleckstrin-like domain